ncbi:helix-turn-helix domain-containing protein [Candidatus Contubernalis alkaliaceticus]|uniref:helix-turn-helix domain-containing protein n=1 Tax=Candidatus Contubernalis alkaliaceticus TaxID=338645 RepID=UPI001F4BD7D2|nr:helix-turn-helix domain-containing protein [Candidatus Contubernalis alkalaceticus]UNC91709.1 MerR family transcriptional regulator [Candidatus Contubernalis alkalaceticus]
MNNFDYFTAKQVCKITGIEYSTLDYWDRTGFIKPSCAEGNGTGSRRQYSFQDLIAIKVAMALKNQGVTLQKLRKVVDYLKIRNELVHQPLTNAILISDGKDVFEITESKDILVDILSGGQLVWALAMDKFIHKLEIRAKRILRQDAA